MTYIKVDHKRMLNAAEKIDGYVLSFDKYMRSVDSAITSLNAEWKGADYQQVKNEWNEINSDGSTSGNMRKSLIDYSGAIREAAKQYKDVQSRAINRANALCK